MVKFTSTVDLIIDLRVMGWARSSFRFESDEGDGYDIFRHYILNRLCIYGACGEMYRGTSVSAHAVQKLFTSGEIKQAFYGYRRN